MSLSQVLFKLLLSGVLVIFIGVACVLFVILLRRLLKVRADRQHTIKLTNQGNVPSTYYIAIDAAEPLLSFKLFLNKVPLVEVRPPKLPEPPRLEIIPVSQPAPAAGEAQPMAARKTSAGLDNAVKSGQQVAAKASAFASVLGVLGDLLPGQLGKSLKEQSGAARNVQANAMHATQAPSVMERKVDALQGQSGKLGVSVPVRTSKSTANKTPETQAGNNAAMQPSGKSVVQSPPVPPKNWIPKGSYCAQTKEIAPGGSVALTLRIGSIKKRYPEGSFSYTIRSQQVPVNRLDLDIEPVVKNGVAHFERVETWRYWLPSLASGVVIFLALITCIYSLTFVW